MRDARIPLFMILLAVSPALIHAQPQTGLISGTVVTSEGDLVYNAHVSAEVMDGRNIITVLLAHTDTHGKFAFKGLAFGIYRISAEKQESGYLSTRHGIFDSRPEVVANLTSNSATFNTEIRFAPKAGVISGWVVDSVTGRSIRAHLSLAPVAGGGWSTTGTSGEFEFQLQIPSETNVRFGACAEGYKRVRSALPVNLKPDSDLKIAVKLVPSSDPADRLCASGTY